MTYAAAAPLTPLAARMQLCTHSARVRQLWLVTCTHVSWTAWA